MQGQYDKLKRTSNQRKKSNVIESGETCSIINTKNLIN